MTRLLPREAAQYLGIGYDKLMQMARLKKIPHWKIGARYFFSTEALDQWILSQENQSVQSEDRIRMIR